MKDLLVMVAICVVVAGGAWFLLGRSPHNLMAPHANPNMITVYAPNPPPDPKTEKNAKAKKAAQEHKIAAGASSKEDQEVKQPATEASLLSPVINPMPSMRTSRRVPAPQEIRIGTDGVDIIRSFGAPLASAYTVDDGHYFEMYFYRGERSQATIHLRDGKVYSVVPR